jgi:enoyl-CoA hydratase/carnithine racemase
MAAGGAFYWLNESDIIICSEEATFFDPHVTYGMTSALEPIGMTYHMPLHDVLRMVLLGNDERIGAGTALRIGLVSEILTLDDLWPRAHELATVIAAKPAAQRRDAAKPAILPDRQSGWDTAGRPRRADGRQGEEIHRSLDVASTTA